MPAVDSAATGIGGHGCPQCGVRNAEADFFALHVSAGLQCADVLVNSGDERIATPPRPINCSDSDQEQDCHCRPDGPTMALRTGHSAECVSQSRAETEDRNKFNEIG